MMMDRGQWLNLHPNSFSMDIIESRFNVSPEGWCFFDSIVYCSTVLVYRVLDWQPVLVYRVIAAG